jgi:signal transduction histidine kinase
VHAQSSTLQHLMRMSPPKESAAPATLPRLKSVTRSHAVFLADASKRLAASLDLDVTLRSMANVSIPEMGIACLVCPLSDAPAVTQVVARHWDPHCDELLGTLTGTAFRCDSSWQAPLLRGAVAGRPALLSHAFVKRLLAEPSPPVDVADGLGLKTGLLVPVMLRGRVLAVVVFFSDHTRYGRHQVRLAEDLASRFALALEAALMYQSCKAALEGTRETLATTLHDVMSPLTSIKGTAKRLRRIEARITDATSRTELCSRLEFIDSAANRMASALTALMQTTRAQAEPWPLTNAEMTDLVILTRRAVAEQQLLAKQHSIVLHGAHRALTGLWNADQIERMLWNLIGNAVKYSSPGSSIEVGLGRESDAEGCWAVVSVSDRGIGIPHADLPFVFEPFRRGSNVGEVDGTGLGLASVSQTVKTHNGRLWVDSEEGRGTCVTIRLPL